eukprot:EG_transcript_7598
MRREGFRVDVVAPSNGSLWTTYNEAGASVTVVEEDYRDWLVWTANPRAYNAFVWGIPSLDSPPIPLPYIRPLPGALSVLWVIDAAQQTLKSRDDVEGILLMDYVLFPDHESLQRCTRFLHGTGHVPINFRTRKNFSSSYSTSSSDVGAKLTSSPREVFQRVLIVPLQSIKRNQHVCPQVEREVKLAVVVHLGPHNPGRLDLVFSALKGFSITEASLWITYLYHQQAPSIQQRALTANLITFPFRVANKGLDIGPFFFVLWQMAFCQYRYRFLLKYHIKSYARDHHFLLGQLFFTKRRFLKTALNFLDRNESVAGVIHAPTRKIPGSVHNQSSPYFYAANRPYLRELQARLRIPIPPTVFTGTMWLTRYSVFWKHLTADAIFEYYSELSQPNGVDWRFYTTIVLQLNCTREEAIWHYYHIGRVQGKPGTCYTSLWLSPARDGMIEHAWERVLSFIISSSGDLREIQ